MSDAPKPGSKEPQSYGSNKEWVQGKTSQTVDRTPEKSDRHDEAFYESKHAVNDDPSIGGQVNSVQRAESEESLTATPAANAQTAVETDSDGRKNFFRDRDYK